MKLASRGYSLTVDMVQNLGSDSPLLLSQPSLEPLPCSVDVLDPEEILYPFDCVALSKVTHSVSGKRTHAIVAS